MREGRHSALYYPKSSQILSPRTCLMLFYKPVNKNTNITPLYWLWGAAECQDFNSGYLLCVLGQVTELLRAPICSSNEWE